MQFYQEEPTARTSWRMAVLLGANSRTYKFALGAALAGQARRGREWVDLDELADPYALALAERVGRFSQAPAGQSLGEQDFLTVCRKEASASVEAGRATARLLEAAVTSMPGMVMQKFHNLRGELALPHRFYELELRGSYRRVRLTADLHAVAAAADDLLDFELAARWSIVESSFSSGLGPVVRAQGLRVDKDGVLVTPVRRVVVTGVRGAISGFQHGRCFYCHEPWKGWTGSGCGSCVPVLANAHWNVARTQPQRGVEPGIDPCRVQRT